MKNSFTVANEKITFRRAKSDDSYKEIAAVLYDTDPYIYPFWFDNNKDEAITVIEKLILTPGSMFYHDNLYVAFDVTTNKIIGVLCGLDYTIDFSYDYSDLKKVNNNYKKTIEKYIEPVIKEVKEGKEMYISNICIDSNYRGKKIGHYLLGYFISQMEKQGYETFTLDCLLHNLRARNLYHSFFFKEMELYIGFDGTDTSKVEAVRMLRKHGTYMPEEFQVPEENIK